ncbi:MAG: hypothetical protein DI601_20500 [Azospirillum brasilense]|nr:MAG: hypothetical protein DI601_20500 [Azospirillum brasilense]
MITPTSPGYLLLDCSKPAEISAAIAQLSASPYAFSVPIPRAALAGELSALWLLQGGRIPARFLDHTRGPTVITIAGDPASGTPAPAPDAFDQAQRLLGWAAFVLIHATGGMEFQYRMVVDATRQFRRVLLIETATAREDDWLALVREEAKRRCAKGQVLPGLALSARLRGGIHPITGADQ